MDEKKKQGIEPQRPTAAASAGVVGSEEGERVLVVPRAALFPTPGREVNGFSPCGVGACLARAESAAQFRRRSAVEEAPAWKQLIPYGVFFCGGEIFVLERRSRGGDPRLYERASIGVGGHVNPVDARAAGAALDTPSPGAAGARRLAATLESALRREIAEELHVRTPFELRAAGILNDDSNAVGRVHFALVYHLEAHEPDVEVRETDRLAGRWVPLEAAASYRTRMETWSQILWDACQPFAPPRRFERRGDAAATSTRGNVPGRPQRREESDAAKAAGDAERHGQT